MSQDETTPELVHCIYTSAATVEFTHDDIMALLEVSRANNAKLGVTGILLFIDGTFFQVLEGEKGIVEPLYDKIAQDPRHGNLSMIIFEEIEERTFTEWTMGYAGLTRRDLAGVEGLNDFFLGGKCYTDLDDGRAKLLLDAFRSGRWRSRIS